MSLKQNDIFEENLLEMEEIVEDCEHICTSDCQKTKDCPCVNEHSHKRKAL